MDILIDDLLQDIAIPNREPALSFWRELRVYIPDAAGATKSHQAWPGGYKDHVQEAMNLARILYERLSSERQLQFPLTSAYLVLFLHDCEKPFRHATDKQLQAFPWILELPAKSDKTFQKKLIEHYGFTISARIWHDYHRQG